MVAGRRRVAVLVAGVLLSASIVMGSSVGVVSAAVEPVDAVVTETGEALDVAGDLVADAAPLVESGDGFVAQMAGMDVVLPSDASDRLVVEGATAEIALELPAIAELDDGVIDESGAVVYESDDAPVSLAAQATADGGLQVLVVLDSPEAPGEYRFDLILPDGATLVSHPDGAVEVVDEEGEPIGLFEAPWAVDATGQGLATEYRIEGHALVQVVELDGATFPVVADPQYFQDCGWVTCTRWVDVKTSKQMNDYRSASANAAWAAIGIAKCGVVGFVTLGLGGVVCASWDARVVLDMNLAIENAAINKGCIKWKWSRQLGQGFPVDWDWTTPSRTSKCKKG